MANDSPQPASVLIAVPQGGLNFERFDLKTVNPFVQRSVSEETRRAYRRVVLEFFREARSLYRQLLQKAVRRPMTNDECPMTKE